MIYQCIFLDLHHVHDLQLHSVFFLICKIVFEMIFEYFYDGQWTSIYVHVLTKAHQYLRVVDIYICSCPHKGTSIAQGNGHLYMFMLSQKHINSLGQWTFIYVHVLTKAHQQPRVVDIYICSCPHQSTSIAQGSGHLYMFMLSQKHINILWK